MINRKKKKLVHTYNPDVDEVIDEKGIHYYADDEVEEKTILKDILTEIKHLRKDLKESRLSNQKNKDEAKQFLGQYEKIIGDVIPKIIPNLNLGSSSSSCTIPAINANAADELKKHLAQYVKEMTKSEVLEHMPNNLKGAYMKLIQNIIKPNDPIFSEEIEPDPREPMPNTLPPEWILPSTPIMYKEEDNKPKRKFTKKEEKEEAEDLLFICEDCNGPIPKGEHILTNDIEYLHQKCADARHDALKRLKKK